MRRTSSLALLLTVVPLLSIAACTASSPQENSASDSTNSISARSWPSPIPTPLPYIPENEKTPAGLLALAKIYLNGTPSEYDLTEARKRLEFIPRTAPEYAEAQRLLTQVKAMEKALKTSLPANPQTSNQSLTAEENAIRENILAADKSITYEHLKKNADRYNGEPWAFSGRVLQIQEVGGQTTALVSLDSWGNKTMYVRANFTTDFVEKDQVYVVGYLAGDYSYTSVAGWNLTVPMINARAILKPSDAARLKGGKKSSTR